jgi:hypothetical protein
MNASDQWYRSPQTNVRPVATTDRLRLLKQSREAKRMVRQHCMPWQFCTSFTHLFSIKLPFLGWTRDQWYCSPQTDVRPVATAALMHLWKQSREAKRMVRYGQEFSFFHFFKSPFFSLFAIFGANTWLVMLQPTGWLLTHCHCHLDVFI